MPTFGGFGGWPRRFGGGRSRVQTIYESLNAARGSAYDTTDSSNVTAETYAQAVALAAAWSNNRRAALQTDPKRMSDFIPRWEAILDLHPSPADSVADRRSAILAKFLAWAGQAAFEDVVAAIMGTSLVDIEYTPIASAYQRWPENGYPNSWISHTAHIVIRVQFAANQSQQELLHVLGRLDRTLADFLPAYTTWDWAMFAENGEDAFFLDDPLGAGPPPNNLNWETLGV